MATFYRGVITGLETALYLLNLPGADTTKREMIQEQIASAQANRRRAEGQEA